MRAFLIITLFFCLTSCLKEELPVPKHSSGGANTVAIPMGNNYKKQVFFSLSDNKIVSSNDREIWDFGFETGADGWHIISNVAKNILIYPTEVTDLTEITSKYGYTSYNYDSPSGYLDSTGMGDWTDGYVRLVDMGITSEGTILGWYKIKITEVTPTSYHFEYAPLQETTITSASIEKDDDYSFVYYSLIDQQQVNVAPKKHEWDLVFTQFIQKLYEPAIMDYLLTGCLSNRYETLAAVVENVDFDDIDLAFAQSLNYSDEINTIGYDWKDIGLDQVMEGGTANYTVYSNKVYIVKDKNDNYFKIKFIDFYSKTGEKGTPTFEYKALN